MSAATIDLFHPVHLYEMEVAALEVLRSGQIASGPKVPELERAFSALSGREHIVSTNDLTSAVTLALHLAGVRAGDDVATIAFSCLQSNSPIARLGARPVWIDIDPDTMSMSLKDLEAKITPSVKAVMLYHIAGYPSDANRISALCRKRGIPLIEDCNNAIGALIDGRPVGTVGEYAVYSLYPNRQINGIDGGMLAVPDAAIAARATRLRRFGVDALSFRDARGEINPGSDVSEVGWSCALSNLNAAVALSQLDTLPDRAERTREVATLMASQLSGLRRLWPVQPVPGGVPAFWGFLLLSEHRDAFLKHLKAYGIKSSIFHHRNDWYSGFGEPRANLPGTELVMSKLLAIPCGWWLTNSQVNEIISRVSEFDAG
ncbi:DegT/DnrJ/EryC1/StrS family aminotransferase [Chitinimonas taiwanensis]|uniref:DegT/DnrJ/EryC1/StrS family aminotransferase n=1 Tax=Chitinimonas taiwanensis TaxID=240412 RepID=UPI0035AF8DB6